MDVGIYLEGNELQIGLVLCLYLPVFVLWKPMEERDRGSGREGGSGRGRREGKGEGWVWLVYDGGGTGD
jgi:hypothetical protein